MRQCIRDLGRCSPRVTPDTTLRLLVPACQDRQHVDLPPPSAGRLAHIGSNQLPRRTYNPRPPTQYGGEDLLMLETSAIIPFIWTLWSAQVVHILPRSQSPDKSSQFLLRFPIGLPQAASQPRSLIWWEVLSVQAPHDDGEQEDFVPKPNATMGKRVVWLSSRHI